MVATAATHRKVLIMKSGELVAAVACDASGRVLGDAQVSICYRPSADAQRTVDTIKAPWMADQDQLAIALQGYGYAVDTWDLLADEESGYVLTATLALQTRPRETELHASPCLGSMVCVQSTFEGRGGNRLVSVTKFVCQACGELVTRESDGS